MKKDIIRPESEKVSLAIAKERNTLGFDEWNVYLLNENDFNIENVIINSFGEGVIDGEEKKTSTLRRLIEVLEANSVAKVESIQEELFALDNIFKITYFADNVLYEIDFTFKAHTIIEENLLYISEIDKQGVIKP
jgi:hypothetical protein